MSKLMGRISQIIGPVVDVLFEFSDPQEIKLPAIHDALYVKRYDGQEVFLEVHNTLGKISYAPLPWRVPTD